MFSCHWQRHKQVRSYTCFSSFCLCYTYEHHKVSYMIEPSIKGQSCSVLLMIGEYCSCMAKSWIQEGWTMEARFVISPTGLKSSLIFYSLELMFPNCFSESLNQAHEGYKRLHSFLVLFTVADSGSDLWHSILVVLIGISACLWGCVFSLCADSFPAEWLQSGPSLWATYLLHLVSCPLFLVPVLTTSHLIWNIQWSISPFPHHSESAGVYYMSFNSITKHQQQGNY